MGKIFGQDAHNVEHAFRSRHVPAHVGRSVAVGSPTVSCLCPVFYFPHWSTPHWCVPQSQNAHRGVGFSLISGTLATFFQLLMCSDPPNFRQRQLSPIWCGTLNISFAPKKSLCSPACCFCRLSAMAEDVKGCSFLDFWSKYQFTSNGRPRNVSNNQKTRNRLVLVTEPMVVVPKPSVPLSWSKPGHKCRPWYWETYQNLLIAFAMSRYWSILE